MHISQLKHIQRREFLKRTTALSLAGCATPLALSLSAMGEASATNASDYKALVCVFLYGGNDHDNTFIPFDDASHDIYKTYRNVGDASASIYWDKYAAATDKKLKVLSASGLSGGRQYAVQPAMSHLADLFESGQLGVLLNVGTLVKPTTKEQYTNKSATLPPKLFSHNDQFNLWQTNQPDGVEGATKGWGGRLGDIFLRNGGLNSKANFTCINASGNAVFVSGSDVMPYQVSTIGAIPINSVGLGNNLSVFGRSSALPALKKILNMDNISTNLRDHWMEKAWSRMVTSSLDNQSIVTSGINNVTDNKITGPKVTFTTSFGADSLSAQMKIIAQLIAAGASGSNMGVKRQVFFVSLGGFDLHDNLMANHSNLLKNVNDAMHSFYKATEQLGLADQVTTFTASDFGRTLASNGDGSDHGWGSHHMVMGGAVNGKRFWGTAPELGLDTTDSVGQGRLLPSTSVDEFAASLATWMGCSSTDLSTVLPNYSQFSSSAALPIFRAGA